MSIQELSITNNQRKLLLRKIADESVLFVDDNDDIVVNVAAYIAYRNALKKEATPLEDAIGADMLDFEHEFFVFS